MALGSVFKGIVSGAKAVGKKAIEGAAAVGQDLGDALAQPEPAQPDATVADMGFDVPDWHLPTLDPNDKDYESKKAIHDAYEELGRMHAEHAKTAGDGYKKYYNDLAGEIRGRATGKQFSPLSMFAIGMGSEEGMKTAGENNRAVSAARSKRDMDLLELKSQALKGQIAQHMEAGKFAQALKSSALLAEVQSVLDRVTSERDQAEKLAQLTVTEEGKNKRTKMIQDRMMKISEDRRHMAFSSMSKLPEKLKLQAQSEYRTAQEMMNRYLKINPVTGLEFSEAEIAAAHMEYLKETDRIAQWVNDALPGEANDIHFSASSSMPTIPQGRVTSVGAAQARMKPTVGQSTGTLMKDKGTGAESGSIEPSAKEVGNTLYLDAGGVPDAVPAATDAAVESGALSGLDAPAGAPEVQGVEVGASRGAARPVAAQGRLMRKGTVTRMVAPDKMQAALAAGYSEVQ